MRLARLLLVLCCFVLSYVGLFVWVSVVYACPLSRYLESLYRGNHAGYGSGGDRMIELPFRDETVKIRLTRVPVGLDELCAAPPSEGVESGLLPGNASLSNSSLGLLVIVLSSPKQASVRAAIRESWASAKQSKAIDGGLARLFFIMGNGRDESVEIAREAELYNDLFVIDAEDNYMNLVYKVLAILHISTTLCPTSFVLKIDEDVVFHVDRFFQGVSHTFNPTDPSIYCHVWRWMRPKRDEDNKWFISKSQFDGKFYPPFCSGSSYVLNSGAAKKMIAGTAKFPFIHVEDVLITGLIANGAGVKRIHLPAMFHRQSRFYNGCPRTSYGVRALLSKHNIKGSSAIKSVWKRMARECPGPRRKTTKPPPSTSPKTILK